MPQIVKTSIPGCHRIFTMLVIFLDFTITSRLNGNFVLFRTPVRVSTFAAKACGKYRGEVKLVVLELLSLFLFADDFIVKLKGISLICASEIFNGFLVIALQIQ